MKFIVLRMLGQLELGWFEDVQRQVGETSLQHALNLDAPELAVVLASAWSTDAIPITLEHRDDRGRITCELCALRRQGKRWRLTCDQILDRRFGVSALGDVMVLVLALDGGVARGAFEVIPQNDLNARRILSASQAARPSWSGLVSLSASDAPQLVRELHALDYGLFGSYLPNTVERSASSGHAHATVVEALDGFDVFGFQPEATRPAPEDDASCRRSAADAQRSIDLHKPVDTDAEWAEVPIDLPAELYRFGREGGLDHGALERIRGLLQEAVVHGCVSERDLGDVVGPCFGDEPDLELDRRLRVVLDELGVEVEVRPWDEDLAPLGCRYLTSEDEDEVEMALGFLMELEPQMETATYMYQREVRAIRVLTEVEEQTCHAEVETGNTRALEAIARCREAVEEVLRSSDRIDCGDQKLRSVVFCGDDDPLVYRQQLESQYYRIRKILRNVDGESSGAIAEGPASEIALVLRQCAFTPRYLESVCEHLRRTPGLDHVHAAVSAGLQASAVARRSIVASNLRLVVWWAVKHRNNLAMEATDLVGEGTLGLIRAVERYRPDHETKLSTYATWWIKQSITRAITDHGRLIRVPAHVWGHRNRILEHQDQVERKTGRRPKTWECAATLGIDPQIVRILIDEIKIDSIPLDVCMHQLEGAVRASSDGVPEKEQLRAELKEVLRDCMSDFDSRSFQVVRGRFGLDDEKFKTLEDLGEELGVSRERVRQIENKAIGVLKHSTRARRLAPFLGEVELPRTECVGDENTGCRKPVSRATDKNTPRQRLYGRP